MLHHRAEKGEVRDSILRYLEATRYAYGEWRKLTSRNDERSNARVGTGRIFSRK
jgi:hypothetical protein